MTLFTELADLQFLYSHRIIVFELFLLFFWIDYCKVLRFLLCDDWCDAYDADSDSTGDT